MCSGVEGYGFLFSGNAEKSVYRRLHFGVVAVGDHNRRFVRGEREGGGKELGGALFFLLFAEEVVDGNIEKFSDFRKMFSV